MAVAVSQLTITKQDILDAITDHLNTHLFRDSAPVKANGFVAQTAGDKFNIIVEAAPAPAPVTAPKTPERRIVLEESA